MPELVALFGGQDNLTPSCVDRWLANAPPECSEDYEISAKFLLEYRGSAETFNAYRREIERFLQWLWSIDNTSLPFLDRDTIHRYMHFSESPPEKWLGENTVHRFITVSGEVKFNPAWRPFIKNKVIKEGVATNKKPEKRYIPSNSARKALLSILSSYFNYMVMEGRAPINPVMMIRQKNRYITKESEQRVIRRLTNEQWNTVLDVVENDTDGEYLYVERAHFIFSAFYLMGVRISEIADSEHGAKTMGNFKRDHHKNWWFTIIGKGNKSRPVPVNDDMLSSLKRYRLARGLSPLPLPGEETPLLQNFSNKNSGLTTRMVRYIVGNYFLKAVNILKEIDPEESHQLSVATVHWLRHTSISEQVILRDKSHVQQDAGHSDSKTTDNYTNVFDLERHESMQKLKIRKNNV